MSDIVTADTWSPAYDQYLYYQIGQPQQAPTYQAPITIQQYDSWSSFSSYPSLPYDLPQENNFFSWGQDSETQIHTEFEHSHEINDPRNTTVQETSETTELSEDNSRRSQASNGAEGVRRPRRRISRACELCQQHRTRCIPGPIQGDSNIGSPCMRCLSAGRQCVVNPGNRGRNPAQRIARLQKQLDRMEEVLRIVTQAAGDRSHARYRPPPENYSHFEHI